MVEVDEVKTETNEKPKSRLKVYVALAVAFFIFLLGTGTGLYFYQKNLNKDLAAKRVSSQYLDKVAVAMNGENQGFYPNIPNDYVSYIYANQYYEGLTKFDNDMRVKPMLADSWENPNDTTWRFRLKKNVKFQNGKTMTSDDVVASLNVAMQNENTSGMIAPVSEVKKVDENTVDVLTKTPSPILGNLLTVIFIMPKEQIDAKDFEHPVGTGPYKFVGTEDDITTFLRNEDYHGEKPKVKTYTLRGIAEQDKRLAALKSGEIDFMDVVDKIPDPKTDKGENIIIAQRDPIDASYLFLDGVRDKTPYVTGVSGVNPLKDLRVRKAIQLALDSSALIKDSDMAFAVPSTQLVSSTIFGFNPNIKAVNQNLNEAKALMKEAGYENGFGITFDASASREKFAKVLKEELAAIKVDVKINLLQPNMEGLMKLLSGDSSMYYLSWGCPTGDALEAYETIFGESGMANSYKYSNKEMNDLITKTQNAFDLQKRKEYLWQMASLADQEKMALPLTLMKAAFAHREGVQFNLRADTFVLGENFSGTVPKEYQKDYTYFGALRHLLKV